MKILIAEDDTITRLMLVAKLKAQRYEVIAARDGKNAWQLYLDESPDVVITDWLMPEIDGLELCRLIRAENRKRYTYIILLTSMRGKGSFLEGLKAGADDFVSKPFEMDELTARLQGARRILNLQHEVDQLQSLLPVCSYCKQIRDDNDVWMTIEEYMSRSYNKAFSHGVCPTCYDERVRPQLHDIKRKQGNQDEERGR